MLQNLHFMSHSPLLHRGDPTDAPDHPMNWGCPSDWKCAGQVFYLHFQMTEQRPGDTKFFRVVLKWPAQGHFQVLTSLRLIQDLGLLSFYTMPRTTTTKDVFMEERNETKKNWSTLSAKYYPGMWGRGGGGWQADYSFLLSSPFLSHDAQAGRSVCPGSPWEPEAFSEQDNSNRQRHSNQKARLIGEQESQLACLSIPKL